MDSISATSADVFGFSNPIYQLVKTEAMSMLEVTDMHSGASGMSFEFSKPLFLYDFNKDAKATSTSTVTDMHSEASGVSFEFSKPLFLYDFNKDAKATSTSTVTDMHSEASGMSFEFSKPLFLYDFNKDAKATSTSTDKTLELPRRKRKATDEDVPVKKRIATDYDEETLYKLSCEDFVKELLSTMNKYLTGMNENYSRWKVVAGFGMTKEHEEKIEIVTFSTGTKGIDGKNIGMTGNFISDCHAEIISRRCLKDFFYSNIELFLEGKGEESIFMKRENGVFCLKPHIKIFLYINTAPCGDGRVFCHNLANNEDDPHPERCNRGLLHVKNYGGKGSIPINKREFNKNLNDIISGQEQLVNMSCSDKIASWNVLGLQGALLSCILEPVYLNGIILSGLFNHSHLQRALYGRIEKNITNLPSTYKLNKPKMSVILNQEIDTNIKNLSSSSSPKTSINWTVGQKTPEIINSKTGKTVTGAISRIAKCSFFNRFKKLYTKLPEMQTHAAPKPPLYGAFKNLAVNYKIAQKVLEKAFQSAGLGCWVKKPAELHQFELDQIELEQE